MLKNRLIPVVLMRQGVCVQSKGFKRYQRLGDPTTIVERLSDWASDELIYLDISRQNQYDLGRDDLQGKNHGDVLSILEEISSRCFMPLTFGGGICTLGDIEERVCRGADKVAINTASLVNPIIVNQASKIHGSQCIVVCIDAKAAFGGWNVYSNGGRENTSRSAVEWAREVADRGAGEILIQSIDEDGRGQGFDVDLVQAISDAVAVPVIALGGVGDWEHFEKGLHAGADAIAAANIFNYTENSVYKAKKHLFDSGFNFREPLLGTPDFEEKAA